MSMITKEDALRLASLRVESLGRISGDEFELLAEATVPVERGWVFFYNSADFVRTKDPAHALAGNGPFFVSLDGQVTELSSRVPWQEALAKGP
jgi:hypothetical protein